MKHTHHRIGLIGFIHGSSNHLDMTPGCANYQPGRGECLDGAPCKVLSGKRCGYFEKVVLPTAGDIGQATEITRLYERRVGAVVGRIGANKIIADRECECGAPLPARRRMCDACAAAKRRKARREYQAKLRRHSDAQGDL